MQSGSWGVRVCPRECSEHHTFKPPCLLATPAVPVAPRWGVRDEYGVVYGVGFWRDGKWHRGSWFRARRECRLLRKQGERNAKVVRYACR